jgi:hypothetical protein
VIEISAHIAKPAHASQKKKVILHTSTDISNILTFSWFSADPQGMAGCESSWLTHWLTWLFRGFPQLLQACQDARVLGWHLTTLTFFVVYIRSSRLMPGCESSRLTHWLSWRFSWFTSDPPRECEDVRFAVPNEALQRTQVLLDVPLVTPQPFKMKAMSSLETSGNTNPTSPETRHHFAEELYHQMPGFLKYAATISTSFIIHYAILHSRFWVTGHP